MLAGIQIKAVLEELIARTMRWAEVVEAEESRQQVLSVPLHW